MPTASPAARYRLKVSLRHISPMIWRRLVVPSDLTLHGLHRAIQIAFGWEDYHLHAFKVHGRYYGTEWTGASGGPAGVEGEIVQALEATQGGATLFAGGTGFGVARSTNQGASWTHVNTGITDLRVFTDVHEEFVARCISEIRIVDVNQHTLDLFGAPDKETLLRNLPAVMRDEMEPCFREQLIDLWDGKLFQQREVVNYALDGTKLNLLLQFSVFPDREHDWSLVLIALTDTTARKKAEAYLEYLYSDEGQTIAAKHYYRPSNPDPVPAELKQSLPAIELVSIDDPLFGGWAKAQPYHFGEGGVFDQIYRPGN